MAPRIKPVPEEDTHAAGKLSEHSEENKPMPVVIACAGRADFLSKPLSAPSQ